MPGAGLGTEPPLTRPPHLPPSTPPPCRPQVEDVLNVIEKERPEGIIVQFGGQTPLKLAGDIQKALEEHPIPAASGALGFIGLAVGALACWGSPMAHLAGPCSTAGTPATNQPPRSPHPPSSEAGRGNVRIWGTSPDSIDEAEDRDRWMALLTKLEIRQPAGGVATNEEQALKIANEVRPATVPAGWESLPV